MSQAAETAQPKLVTIAEIRAQFPAGIITPSEKWISRKARELKLGRQYGKVFLVRSDFISRYLESEPPCQASGEKPKKTVPSRTPGAVRSRSGKRTARQPTSALSEALELARSPKPARAESKSKENITSASICRFPKPQTSR
jgi:hypothetical protein